LEVHGNALRSLPNALCELAPEQGGALCLLSWHDNPLDPVLRAAPDTSALLAVSRLPPAPY
jgi:hypothetical protein